MTKNQKPKKESLSSWWLRLSVIYLIIISSAFYISKNNPDVKDKPLQSAICKLSMICKVYGETMQYVNQTMLLPNAPLPQEQYTKERCICPSIKEE